MKRYYKQFVQDKYQSGEICPWWKGHVYYDIIYDRHVVAPIGFNIIFQFIYHLWLSVRIGIKDAIRFQQKQIKLREANISGKDA